MTDQNNLARDYSSDVADDDPLAELARIVSGQPVKPAASFKPKSFADIARAKTGELQAMAERQAADLQAAELQAAAERQAAELRRKAVAERQPDIEEALMRELGFSMGEEPEPRKEAVAAFVEAAPVEEFLPPHFEIEAYREPEAEPVAPQLSLEEQLMAELMADDAAPSDPYADIWTERTSAADLQPAEAMLADVHEQAYEEFRSDAADWREIDPEEGAPEYAAAGEAPEETAYADPGQPGEMRIYQEAQAYQEARGYEDTQAHEYALPEPEEFESLLAHEFQPLEAGEQPDQYAADPDGAVEADFVQQFQDSFEQEFGNRFAEEQGGPAGAATTRAGIGVSPERDQSYAASRNTGFAALGAQEARDMADDDFLKELDAAFEPGDPDPYEVDFTELEMATDLASHVTSAPSQPAAQEDELFRELAQGSLPAQSRSSAAAAGASPLYGATAPLFASQQDAHPAPAEHEAGFDDFDFGDALEAEVRQAVEAGSAGAPVARAAAPSPRLVEEQFAAAFAEELDMGDSMEADGYGAPRGGSGHSGGWQPAETQAANRDFVELAAPRALAAAVPSAHDQYAEAHACYDDAIAYGDDDPGFEQAPDVAPAPAGLGGRARGGFVLAASALGVALVLGGGALAYGYFSGSVTTVAADEAAPIIKADAGPVKIKPEEPGGAEVQNQDKAVYDAVAGRGAAAPQQETLISTSEEPVDVAALAAEDVPLPQDDLPVGPEAQADGETAAADGAAVAETAADAKVEERLTPGAAPVQPEAQAALAPRRVRTVVVTPDGKIIARPDPAPAEAPAAATPIETAFAAAPPQARPDAVAAVAPEAPQAVREEARPETVAAAPEAQPVEAAPEQRQPVEIAKAESEAPPPAPSAAPWAVQLASQRSAEDAQATFQNLRRKFPDILANRALAVQRADVEGKGTFFRVRLPAQTKAEASQICEQLKAAGGSCFVTR